MQTRQSPRDRQSTRTQRVQAADRVRSRVAEQRNVSEDKVSVQRGQERITGRLNDEGRATMKSRVREEAAEGVEGVGPGRIRVNRNGRSYETAGVETRRSSAERDVVPYKEFVGRKRAAEQLASETDLNEIDPFRDLESRGEGFSLTAQAERRAAAASLDEQYDEQNVGPNQVRREGDGFRATEQVERRGAANDLDEQIPLINIGFNDVSRSGGAYGLDESAEKRLGAEKLDRRYDDFGVSTGDVERTGGGFSLDTGARRELTAQRYDEQFPDVSIGTGDVERTNEGFGLERSAQKRIGAAQLDEKVESRDIGVDDVEWRGDELIFRGRI